MKPINNAFRRLFALMVILTGIISLLLFYFTDCMAVSGGGRAGGCSSQFSLDDIVPEIGVGIYHG